MNTKYYTSICKLLWRVVLAAVLLLGFAPQAPPAHAQTTLSVSGMNFKDLDADGAKDEGEPGLSGWTIYVDYNDNNLWEANEPQAVTDQYGGYTISGITTGTYKVRELVQEGWTCTYPNRGTADTNYKPVVSNQCWHSLTFTSTSALIGKDFGNRLTSTVDPAWDYKEWPDDELFIARPSSTASDQDTFEIITTDADLTTTSLLDSRDASISQDGSEEAVAAGHMLDPKNESVVMAIANNQNLKVKFFRPETVASMWEANDMFAARNGCDSFMDIAAGDLDNSLDQSGQAHEEVVVVYAQDSSDYYLPIKVSVLDFTKSTAAAPQPQAITSAWTGAEINVNSLVKGDWPCAGNALGVATGDFDGDSFDEIAVGYQTRDDYYYHVEVFRYTTVVQPNGQKVYSLVLADSYWRENDVAQYFGWTYISLDIAADDFDGNGRDEVAIAYSGFYDLPDDYSNEIMFEILRFFVNPGKPNLVNRKWYYLPFDYGVDLPHARVQIVTGLFGIPYDLEGPIHPNLTARQLIFAYTTTDSSKFTIGYLYYHTPTEEWIQVGGSGNSGLEPPVQGPRFELAAGGFKGPRTADDYLWSLAVGVWDGNLYQVYFFHILDPADARWIKTTIRSASGAWRHPMVAVDTDGNGLFLGPPVEMTIDNLENIKILLQEPPKHTYWDPDCYVSPPDCDGVITVSRWDNFYIEFKSGTTGGFSNKTTNQSDVTYGGTGGLSFDISEQWEKKGIFIKKSTTLGMKIAATAGQQVEEHGSSYNSNYQEYTVTYDRSTKRDDVVVGETSSYTVWRYPMYGYEYVDEQGNPMVAYMDIVMPESKVNTPAAYGATNVDGWEPVWENGNILSYPKNDAAYYILKDLGSFRIACLEGETGCVKVSDDPEKWEKEVNSALAWGTMFADATGGSAEISLEQSEGSGSEQSYSSKWTANADAKIYYEKKANRGLNLKAEATGTFNYSDSWSEITTAENTTTTSRSLYLTSDAPVTADQSYAYFPQLYITKDGVVKLTFAVDPLDGYGRNFWLKLYGDVVSGPDARIGKPDPALNLPGRFIPVFSTTDASKVVGWKPQVDEFYHNEIRGFFVKEPELDPNLDPELDGYPSMAHAPIAGEPVRLEVLVNNYSLSDLNGVAGTPGNPLEVKFYATATRLDTMQVFTDTIGSVFLTNLLPREPQIAAINWTPPVFGIAGAEQVWRVNVQLDPQNTIDEIYDTDLPKTYCPKASCTTAEYIDPGQNNHGFKEVVVLNQIPGDNLRAYKPKDISLQKKAFCARNRNGKPDCSSVQAYAGEPLPIRIQVSSDKTSIQYSRVLLYDGDPANGGMLIGSERPLPGPFGLTRQAVWTFWIPESLGPHTLYAVLLEDSDDLLPGNNIATLKVIVIRAPKGPKK